MIKKISFLVLALVLVASCAPSTPPPASSKMSALGKAGAGGYKVGNPYQINSVWYYPKEDYAYDETGIASWYGADFHNRSTSNGETFDKNELTAAHKTLPMPSLVRVTNLENGRSIVARVNDRGPFTPGRVVDLSERGAELLGFKANGTAKVRVQILADESRSLAEAAKKNGTIQTASLNEPAIKAAPIAPVSVAQAEPLPLPAKPAPAPAKAPAPAPTPVTAAAAPTAPVVAEKINLPGRVEDNRFLPAPQVSNVPVKQNSNLWIQAGAFTMPENAQRLKEKLASVGATVISTVNVGNKPFHRVRVGPVASVESADKMLDKVLGMGLTGARIVVE